MAQARYYSSIAQKTTLVNPVGTTDTSLTVASISGYPSSFPFTLIIDRDTIDEEVVECTGVSGSVFTVTRGIDSTTAVAHSVGAQVEHGTSARDYRDPSQHIGSDENVHGIGLGAAVVGTDTAQTLSNKTLGSDLAAGGFKVTGLADPSSAQDAVTKTWAETAMSSQLAQATTQATNAAASAATASGSESAAAASESAAAASESAAAASETAAAGSATAAASSASGAASSESAATASELAAASSESSAAASESAASASESAAASSASAASGSATAAGSSATAAASSATAASGSETAAAASAAAAAASELAAAGSETAAAASETAAGVSEANASSSATASAASATAASGSESAAAASESAAATSATASAASATSASADAVSAAASAAAAASSYDQFDDRYLGAKSDGAPSTDNDGNPLVTGALYYDSVEGKMFVYDGSGWLPASAASVASIVTYEYVATASQTVFTGSDANGVSLSFTSGLIQVFLNGVLLSPGDDYTTSTNTVTLASGAAASDVLVVVAFASFNVADTYTQAQTDAAIASATAGLGGATGGGSDQVFYENDQTVTTSYTITTAKNAITAGPVTINSGVTVTVPSGSYWSVV